MKQIITTITMIMLVVMTNAQERCGTVYFTQEQYKEMEWLHPSQIKEEDHVLNRPMGYSEVF